MAAMINDKRSCPNYAIPIPNEGNATEKLKVIRIYILHLWTLTFVYLTMKIETLFIFVPRSTNHLSLY